MSKQTFDGREKMDIGGESEEHGGHYADAADAVETAGETLDTRQEELVSKYNRLFEDDIGLGLDSLQQRLCVLAFEQAYTLAKQNLEDWDKKPTSKKIFCVIRNLEVDAIDVQVIWFANNILLFLDIKEGKTLSDCT